MSSPHTEELRTEYKIMTNLWLLAQMREPGRRLYADLNKDTFMDFADEFISEKNFLREKRINGSRWLFRNGNIACATSKSCGTN